MILDEPRPLNKSLTECRPAAQIGVVIAACVLGLGCASAALWVMCKPPPPKPEVKEVRREDLVDQPRAMRV